MEEKKRLHLSATSLQPLDRAPAHFVGSDRLFPFENISVKELAYRTQRTLAKWLDIIGLYTGVMEGAGLSESR